MSAQRMAACRGRPARRLTRRSFRKTGPSPLVTLHQSNRLVDHPSKLYIHIVAKFDPAKDAKNVSKHRISLSRWNELEMLAVFEDDRFDYGEPRYRAYGLIDEVAYCLAFTIRDDIVRPISLRRAHAQEMKRYVQPKA